jgi:hypothetical protein
MSKEIMVEYDPTETIEVLCERCGKNKVKIRKNSLYFGILCRECSFRYTKLIK